MNSEPLSESMPRSRKGRRARSSSSAACTAVGSCQHGRRFHPGGVDVGEVQRMHELAVSEAAAMGDEVNLGEAGGGDVPPVGLYRDVMLEQAARLGASIQRW